MTEHEQIEYLIFEFLNGKLSEEDETSIKEWVSRSENKSEFERYKRLFEEQRRQVPDHHAIVSREKLKTALLIKFYKSRRKDQYIIHGLLTACLLFTGLFFLYVPKNYHEPDQNFYSGSTTVKTEAGETSSCILPDSTKIWLNEDSEIEYHLLSGNSGKTREVKVRGEVYLDVAKEKKIPFEVLCGNTKIKVYGTQFNVRQREESLQVTLVEGSMAVFKDGIDKISELIPGDQVTLDLKGNLIEKKRMGDLSQVFSWKEGRYEFKDVTLEEVILLMNDIYGVNLTVLDVRLKKQRFRCVIDRKKSLLQTLQILKEATNLDYSINGSDIVLTQIKNVYDRKYRSVNKN